MTVKSPNDPLKIMCDGCKQEKPCSLHLPGDLFFCDSICYTAYVEIQTALEAEKASTRGKVDLYFENENERLYGILHDCVLFDRDNELKLDDLHTFLVYTSISAFMASAYKFWKGVRKKKSGEKSFRDYLEGFRGQIVLDDSLEPIMRENAAVLSEYPKDLVDPFSFVGHLKDVTHKVMENEANMHTLYEIDALLKILKESTSGKSGEASKS